MQLIIDRHINFVPCLFGTKGTRTRIYVIPVTSIILDMFSIENILILALGPIYIWEISSGVICFFVTHSNSYTFYAIFVILVSLHFCCICIIFQTFFKKNPAHTMKSNRRSVAGLVIQATGMTEFEDGLRLASPGGVFFDIPSVRTSSLVTPVL